MSVTPTTVHILTSRKITVAGSYWPPNTKVVITYTGRLLNVGVTTENIGSQNVQPDGTFSWTNGVPSDAVPGTTADIKACDGTICRDVYIAITD